MKQKTITIELIKCACGCGKSRPRFDTQGRERYYINGHTLGGKHHSEASIQKMRISQKGKHLWQFLGIPKSEEHKRKISESLKGHIAWNKGKHLSDATKKKLSEANKGKIRTAETRRKMSLAYRYHIPWNKGKKNCYSKETLLKISLALRGRKGWNKGKHWSEEMRKKFSQAQKGKHSTEPLSEEHRRKISISNMGKRPTNKNIPHSLQTKRKMSIAMRLWWNNRKK